jgi:hypothetical protein
MECRYEYLVILLGNIYFLIVYKHTLWPFCSIGW